MLPTKKNPSATRLTNDFQIADISPRFDAKRLTFLLEKVLLKFVKGCGVLLQ